MEALERIKSQTNNKELQDEIDSLINQVEELPEQIIQERKLLRKRARQNYKW